MLNFLYIIFAGIYGTYLLDLKLRINLRNLFIEKITILKLLREIPLQIIIFCVKYEYGYRKFS